VVYNFVDSHAGEHGRTFLAGGQGTLKLISMLTRSIVRVRK
jgi:hypothetical protein